MDLYQFWRSLEGMTEHRWLYGWMLAAVAFGAASLLVPLYLIERGGDAVALGALAGTAGFAGAFGAAVFGTFADGKDRRRSVFLGGMGAVGVALALLPVAATAGGIIALNAVIWFTVAAVTPALTLMVLGDAPEHTWQRRIAHLSRMQGLGWAAGLLLGFAWMAAAPGVVPPETAFHLLFIGMAGTTLVGILLGAAALPGHTPTPSTRRARRFLARSGREVSGSVLFLAPVRVFAVVGYVQPSRFLRRFTRPLAGFFAAALLFFTGFGMYFALLPLFLREIGVASGAVFGLFFLANATSAVMFERAGVLVDRYDARVLTMGMSAVRALLFPVVGLGAAAVAGTLPGTALLAAAFVLTGFTWAVIAVAGTTTVTRLAPAAIRGEAIGVYTALGAVAGGIGSFIGGILARDGYTPMFIAAGLLCLAGAAAVAVLRDRI